MPLGMWVEWAHRPLYKLLHLGYVPRYTVPCIKHALSFIQDATYCWSGAPTKYTRTLLQ